MNAVADILTRTNNQVDASDHLHPVPATWKAVVETPYEKSIRMVYQWMDDGIKMGPETTLDHFTKLSGSTEITADIVYKALQKLGPVEYDPNPEQTPHAGPWFTWRFPERLSWVLHFHTNMKGELILYVHAEKDE